MNRTTVWALRRLLRGLMAVVLVVASLMAQPGGSEAEGGKGELIESAASSFTRTPELTEATAVPASTDRLTDVVLYPGPVDVPDAIVPAIKRALIDGGSEEAKPAYSITNLECDAQFCIASFVGFNQLLDSVAGRIEWTLSDASELGALVVARSLDGTYRGARAGSKHYADLVDGSTSGIAARLRDSSRLMALRSTAPRETRRFPWQDGKKMKYGERGLHTGGYAETVAPGWVGIDFVSDGDTSAGHADAKVYAAESGRLEWVCSGGANGDGTTVAFRIGSSETSKDGLIYAHLKPGSVPFHQGQPVARGDDLGELVPGAFKAGNCGYQWNQTGSNFHLHFAFPYTTSFEIGGWKINPLPNPQTGKAVPITSTDDLAVCNVGSYCLIDRNSGTPPGPEHQTSASL